MVTGQRTFELIPTSLVKSNGQRRPMTSKAAKKAYQQANRGPKISRAEQRRRDNAELEQQKKEYEKERAAARAKAAREKKAAKANAEKEARRKQGIPEPSRYVRPSQPTISRFVRSDSTNKRTWQQMESVAENSDQTMSDTEQDDGGPPAKRRSVDEGSDDEFGEFPSFSQSDILEKIDSPALPVKKGSAPKLLVEDRVSSQSRRHKVSQELPRMKEADEDSILNTQALDELVTTQLLSDLVEAVVKSDSVEPPDCSLAQRRNNTPKIATQSQPSPRRSGRVAEKAGKEKDVLSTIRPSTRPVVEIPAMSFEEIQHFNMAVNSSNNIDSKNPVVLQGRSVNMPPPSLPKRVNTITKPVSTPQKPIFLARGAQKFATKPFSNVPPSSTQAFLENHLDDFFPSPTQAVRELLEDVDDLPSETQIARELNPERLESSHLEDMLSTQDFILSPYDLEEIISPRRSSQKALKETRPESLNRRQHAQSTRQPTPEKAKNDLLDRMSTQDLVLSPKDLEEIISQRTPLKDFTADALSHRKYAHNARRLTHEKAGNDIEDFMCSQDICFSPTDPEVVISPLHTPEKRAFSESITRREHTDDSRQPKPEGRKNDLDDFMSSQHLVFSHKDVEVVNSPHRTAEKQAISESIIRREHTDDSKQSNLEGQNNDLDDFMSTQDLVLSSEDLEEICPPARRPAISPYQRIPDSPKPQAKVQPHSTVQEKRRFFQEKEEDLYHAAIQESKATSAQVPAKPRSDNFASAGRNQSDSTDYGDFDFDLPGLFKDKEDEELEAAIRESKITAELEAKRLAMASTSDLSRVLSNSTDYGDFDLPGLFEEREEDVCKTAEVSKQQLGGPGDVNIGANNSKAKPKRFFEEKYEDQVHAAIHESKTLAAKATILEKPKSTTKATLSTATDNGDKPFLACPEEKPKRFFEEKYEDQVYAAIQESKKLAAKPVTSKEGLENPKRTMKRILSTATDYGDDDFTGCSQELLELC